MAEQIKAVIFDIGGVLVPSPVNMILDYGSSKGLPKSTFVKTIVHCSEESAWAKWERAELSMEQFGQEFTKECCQESGVDVNLNDFPHLLEREFTNTNKYRLHPELKSAIKQLRHLGYKTAILSNNFIFSDGQPIQPIDSSLFDEVVESSRVQMRKPDSRIFDLTLQLLNVQPNESLFLDDLQINITAAQKLGLHAIKVSSLEQMLNDLQSLLDVQFAN